MNSQEIKPLNIKSLLSEGRYVIPIYQRNYDWGENEALQLIEDITDYASFNSSKNYYIGSVVVFVRYKDRQEYFEIIDGQQRLTTLTILLSLLRSFEECKVLVSWFDKSNLSYDHRHEADEAIRQLSENQLYDNSGASSIAEVYRIMQKNILNILEEKGISLIDFVNYLLSKVIIMRIPVPQDTELNHYFEIMNSRGEQLEKHEVLKASLMNCIDKKYHLLFNDIWEACSDMDTYVQMNFKPQLRTILFSKNWVDLTEKKFDDIYIDYINIVGWDDDKEETSEYVSRTIEKLFEDALNNVKYTIPDDSGEKGNDRFGSIINFPNFLLHTLKIMYFFDENEYKDNIDEEIKLDDKRLIDIFSTVINSCKDKARFVKKFIMTLLQMRNLFDMYIIKREYYNSKESWSLKSLKKYDSSKTNYIGTFTGNDSEDEMSKDIRMLEAMFHVSAPTQIYKYWMNAVLFYIYKEETINLSDFRDYLYKLACTYMLDRYLCEKKTEFEDIIYKNEGSAENNSICWDFIDRGCDVENFIFNFYDYLTWKTNPRKYSKFEFSYRTSVEHFYPQTPMTGYPVLDKSTGLHSFGNLCLISRGMNSKFSNNMPMAKYKNFGNEDVLDGLSLKLKEMMEIVKDKGDWFTDEINKFEDAAKNRLLRGIQAGCKSTIKVL